MQHMNPVNPALASLLQVANMVTPDQTPTVAAQVASAAEQKFAPQMSMPSVQNVAQDAGIGGQVGAYQQQQQQQQMMQALQQMMQRQQAQDNAMRFGVAAAPGAQNIGMAEGGIVGYATGSDAHPLNDPEALEKIKKELWMKRAREGVQRLKDAAAPTAPAAAESTGILSALARRLPVVGGVIGTAMAPEETKAGLLNALPFMKMAEPFFTSAMDKGRDIIGGTASSTPTAGGRPTMANDPRLLGATPPEETAGSDAERARNMAQVAGEGAKEAAPVRGQGVMAAAPQRAPAAPVRAPQLPGPSGVDALLKEARTTLGEYETEAPKPSAIAERLKERDVVRDEYQRSRGIDPDQYKRDIERSQEREQRKLAGIEALRKESEAANTGIRGLVKLLSAAGGRTDPLTAIGVQYGNMTAQQLADNEKFMKAREEVMDNEDKIQATIREKRRAEVAGDYKAAEDAATRERDARNKKRDAQITMATEAAKLVQTGEQKQLDRETQVLTTKMHTDAQREVAAATREGTLETRRASILANISRAEQSEIGKAQSNYNKRLTSIGIFPGVKPTPDQVKALQEAQAEYDLRVAGISRQAAEDRAMVMGGTGGGAFKVERVK